MLLPILLVFFAGGLIAIQAPTNALLAKAGGSPVLAALISFVVGTIGLFIVWLASGNRPDVAAFGRVPWYAWLGGLYGACFVAVAAYAAPKIGIGSLITIGIAGQIAVALFLDNIGAMGLPKDPLTLSRAAGAVLVIAGVVLVRRG
jgi:transporter family-2 protein